MQRSTLSHANLFAVTASSLPLTYSCGKHVGGVMGFESYAGSPAYWFWDPVCCRNTLAWVRRHWAVSLHLLLAIAVAGIAFSFLAIRQSAPSQLAFTQACSHPAVSAMLGTPV